MYLYLWIKKKDEKIWILKGGIKYLIIIVKYEIDFEGLMN